MHYRETMCGMLVAFFVAGTAQAGDWDDAVAFVAGPGRHHYPATTDVFVRGLDFACPSGVSLMFTDDYGTNAQGCEPTELVSINLNEFARQGTLDAFRLETDAAMKRIQSEADRNTTGVAMSFAMAGVGDIAPGETVAISANWGTFGGRNGLAGGFAVRATENVSFNGGVAFGDKGGAVGGRAGIRFAW